MLFLVVQPPGLQNTVVEKWDAVVPDFLRTQVGALLGTPSLFTPFVS